MTSDYNYFRTYDPATGRYLNADPLGQVSEANVYVYTGSNPQNRVGVDGRLWGSAAGLAARSLSRAAGGTAAEASLSGALGAAATGAVEDAVNAGNTPGSGWTPTGAGAQAGAGADAALSSVSALFATDVAAAAYGQAAATGVAASPAAAVLAVAAAGVLGFEGGNAARAASVALNGIDPGTWWGNFFANLAAGCGVGAAANLATLQSSVGP